MQVNRFPEFPELALIALLSITAACSPADDDPDASVTADELTNVDPYEAVPAEEPPEIDESNSGTAESRHAIDPRGAEDLVIPPVDMDLYADAKIDPASDSTVNGSLRFHQDGDIMRITGTLRGLDPGKHGLHVHVAGDCSASNAKSALGHFAPDDDPHGSPGRPEYLHHVGDLGNIVANSEGVAEIDKTDTEMTLQTDEYTILDRAVIVHAEPDDLASQPSGDAGDRIGCGVVKLDVAPAYSGA